MDERQVIYPQRFGNWDERTRLLNPIELEIPVQKTSSNV